MLNLNARIDFNKVEFSSIRILQKLDRSGVLIVCSFTDTHTQIAQRLTLDIRHKNRGRALNNLLIATLYSAVTLPQMNQSSVPIAKQLHLDVARSADELL
jgi:hypothetical protein